MRFLKLLALATFPLLATAAVAHDVQIRDLTVEQATVTQVGTQRPGSLRMSLAADRPDWTYGIGETVGLLLTTNEDAYVTVLDIGPTGRVTQLFPNPYQPDSHVLANSPVEIGGASGARVTVTGTVGAELIKVIASSRPVAMISRSQLRRQGAFFTVDGGVPTVLRDLQVVADQVIQSDAQIAVMNLPLWTVADVAGAPALNWDNPRCTEHSRGSRDRTFQSRDVPLAPLMDRRTACASR
jgi:Domain of unknown function (DUF4384)